MTDSKAAAISIEATIHTTLDNFFREIHRDYGIRVQAVYVDWSPYGITETRVETSRVHSNILGDS